MTTAEAISYIENYTWSTTRLGLERTQELLRKLGDPQKLLPQMAKYRPIAEQVYQDIYGRFC